MKNKYTAFYSGDKIEDIPAATSYEAQQKAIALFQSKAGRRKVKNHMISVVLQDVTHSTASI